MVLGSGMHIIEETQVFKEPQSVENLVISPMQVEPDSSPQYSGLASIDGGSGEVGQWLCVSVSWGVANQLSSLAPSIASMWEPLVASSSYHCPAAHATVPATTASWPGTPTVAGIPAPMPA